jgi:hypothetical protein
MVKLLPLLNANCAKEKLSLIALAKEKMFRRLEAPE